MRLPVTFFYPYPGDLAQMASVELDGWRFWNGEWKERRRAWSLRTYMTLRQAGYDVKISPEIPARGLVVIGPEREMRRAFLRRRVPRKRKLLVAAIRADLPRCTFADIEIVQNGKFDDGQRVFHVPHWPQPGLVPRDPARGTRVETIAFKGYTKNFGDAFSSARWKHFLREHDLRLEGSTEASKDEGGAIAWHDYAGADVTLAVRKDPTLPYVDKPASKLFNAWRAGTPALLGPEYAFREQRRSPLDYVEVTSLDDVMNALLRLKADPERYQAMVHRGHERAEAFAPARIAERWAEVLFQKAPHVAETRSFAATRSLPLPVRGAVHLARRPPDAAERGEWRRRARDWGYRTVQSRLRPWLGRWRRKLAAGLRAPSKHFS